MFDNFDSPRPPRRVRRTPGDRLRDGVMALAGTDAVLIRKSEKSWASITFAGARHTLEIVFTGAAIADGETFTAILPDHEFAIPGQLVADAAITAADHTLLPSPRLLVTCELLLLEDG